MILTTLPMIHFEVVAYASREIDHVKLKGVIANPPIAKDMDTIMPLWMQ